MILKLYRRIGPGTILIIVLTGFFVWLRPFLNPVESGFFYHDNPMPLYSLMLGVFDGKLLAGSIFSYILVLIIGIYLVNFNTRLFFINERTFIPAALYVILSGYLIPMQGLNPVLPATLLLIIAIDRIISAYRRSGIAYNFFDASLILGVASLLYFNIIWYFLIVIIGILIIRTFNIREIIISLFGFITPYIVLYTIYYLRGEDISMLNTLIVGSITTEVPGYYWSPVLLIISAINGSLLLVSVIHLLSVFNTKKVRSRKVFSLFFWVIIVSILAFLLVPSVSVEMVYVFLVPVVYIMTHFMVFTRNKKIANIFFAIIFISVIVLQIK